MQLKSIVKGPVLGLALVTVAGMMIFMAPCRHSCGAHARAEGRMTQWNVEQPAGAGSFRVETTPPGATVTLDGMVLPVTTPATVAATPGTHLLGLSRPGFHELVVVAGVDGTQGTLVRRTLPPVFQEHH